jgi:alkyl sulfatase BDS1-like metallo-beta-lactamase superfamily hydrolase
VAPESVAADVVNAAGAEALVDAAHAHVAAGQPVQVLHLTDLVLAAEPSHTAGRAVAADAHEALLPAPTTSGKRPGSPNPSTN